MRDKALQFARLVAIGISMCVGNLPFTALANGEFTELFNGTDLTGWDRWLGAPIVPRIPIKLWGDWPEQIGLNRDEDGVFSVVTEDGGPALRISGETWGALISRHDYANYHLQLQYKWGDQRFVPRTEKPRNSGLLYHSTGDYGVFWSYWMRSVEFEIMEGRTGDFTSVDSVVGEIRTRWDWSAPYPWQRYASGGEPTTVGGMVFRVFAVADRELPLGQWNTLDLFVLDDRAIHQVNGYTVMEIEKLRHEVDDKSVPLVRGRIQLQSEGAEVYFRHLRLRPIDTLLVAP